MKKAKSFRRVLIGILLLACLFLPLYQLKADSGFDGSYDSGSSGSSSSSSSSSSSDFSSSGSLSGRGTPISEEDVPYIIVALFIASISGFFIAKKLGNLIDKLAEKVIQIESSKKVDPLANVPLYNKEELVKVLPNFVEKDFLDKAYKIYKDVQIAWMNADMDAMKSLVTDAMYNMYSAQIQTLLLKKEKNIMEDFLFLSSYIDGMSIDEESVSLYVNMKLECFDYIVNKNGRTIRGNDSKKVRYNYLIVFTRSILKNENKCPNCGAKLKNTIASKCSYCHLDIINKNHDWVMAKKMVISQTENANRN